MHLWFLRSFPDNGQCSHEGVFCGVGYLHGSNTILVVVLEYCSLSRYESLNKILCLGVNPIPVTKVYCDFPLPVPECTVTNMAWFTSSRSRSQTWRHLRPTLEFRTKFRWRSLGQAYLWSICWPLLMMQMFSVQRKSLPRSLISVSNETQNHS